MTLAAIEFARLRLVISSARKQGLDILQTLAAAPAKALLALSLQPAGLAVTSAQVIDFSFEFQNGGIREVGERNFICPERPNFINQVS